MKLKKITIKKKDKKIESTKLTHQTYDMDYETEITT
jgi:hypothetical protein